MTEQELRALVREAIARHASAGGGAPAPQPHALALHVSHGLFPLSRGSDDGGACTIEPAVRCNHCGFCVSFGH